MRRAASPEVVWVDDASPESSFRELDDAFLQTQTRIWLGEVLHLRFDEETSIVDLLADGELLFQVSKVIWKMLLKKNKELKQSKSHIYERTSFGKGNGRYMPYPKVDSFLKICQILGLTGIDLFTPSDVVEKRDVRRLCMCIRTLSRKARSMSLNVPDFDIVTYTIAMPSFIVGGICRNWEHSQCSSSSSSGYSSRTTSKELYQQSVSSGHNYQNDALNYDSDEAESRLRVLEHEDSIDECSFPMFLQLSNAPQVRSKSYGEKSVAESVDSLDFDMIRADCTDSPFSAYSKESSYSTHGQAEEFSINIESIASPLSLEKLSSCRSRSNLQSNKNDSDGIPPTTSNRIYGHGQIDPTQLCSLHAITDQRREDGKGFSIDPAKEADEVQRKNANFQPFCEQEADYRKDKPVLTEKYTVEETSSNPGSFSGLADHDPGDKSNVLQLVSPMQNDTSLTCDMESVDSNSEDIMFGLKCEPSDLTSSSEAFSEVTAIPTIDRKLPAVSEYHVSRYFLLPEAYYPNAPEYIFTEVTPSEHFTTSCSTNIVPAGVHSIENLEKINPTSSPGGGVPEISTNFVSAESRKPFEREEVDIEQSGPCKENVVSNLASNLPLSLSRCLNSLEVLNELQSVSCDHSISLMDLHAQIEKSHLVNVSHHFCSSPSSEALGPQPVPGAPLTEQERCTTIDLESVRKQLLDKEDSEELVIEKSNAQGAAISPTVSASAKAWPLESNSGSPAVVSDFSSHEYRAIDGIYNFHSGIVDFSRESPQKTTTKVTEFKDDCTDELQGESTEQLSMEQDQLLQTKKGDADQLLETEKGDASQAMEAEYGSHSLMGVTQGADKLATIDDTDGNNSSVKKARGGVSNSGKTVLRSVAGGITLAGAVFFILRLRNSRERNLAAVMPLQSEKSVQNSSRPKNMEKGKTGKVYPGQWLQV